MSGKPMFVVLTGPSGSGKSTAIAGVMENINPEIEIVVPLRLTTRPPRKSDNPMEVSSVSAEDFQKDVDSGQIVIPHQIRDKWNGLALRDQDSRYGPCSVYMQALPTSAGVAIKQEFSDKFNVLVCRLKARKDIVLSRLAQRGPKDDAPSDEAARRAVVTPAGNDWELDAERSAADVRDSLINMIQASYNLPTDQWFDVISDLSGFKPVDAKPDYAMIRQQSLNVA